MKWIKRGNETNIMDVVLRNMDMTGKSVKAWFTMHSNNDYKIDKLDDACRLCAKYKNLPVTICGDYDADGITSTSIIYLGLTWLGFTKVSYRIPKRFSEGYGLNENMVNEAKIENGKGLLIIVDNGIKAFDALAKAKEKGFDIIILDHHEPENNEEGNIILPKLSDTDVLIDPEAIKNSAIFTHYCGAGLAYKFIKNLISEIDSLREGILLSLAAIGTVGDVVELREENYVIVRKGIKAMLNGYVTNGLSSLLRDNELTEHITSTDIGFTLAPIINACERMHDGGAEKAVKLLVSGIPGEAVTLETVKLVSELMENNKKRKECLTIAKKQADNLISSIDIKAPIVLYLPNVLEGIVGLIASDISNKYKIPAFVVTDAEGEIGILKGSGRSYVNVDSDGKESFINIYDILENNKELLVAYGGHEKAAGITFKKSDLENIKKSFINFVESQTNIPVINTDTCYYDLEIDSKDLDSTISELVKMEPFGNGNNPIIFKINNYTCLPNQKNDNKTLSLCGSEMNTVRIIGKGSSAIGFGMSEFVNDMFPEKVTLYGELSNNYFRGICKPQVSFIGIEYN